MRNMKLLTIATMGLALMLGAVACSGDMSGTGVEPPKEPEATTQPGLAPEKATEVAGQPAPVKPGAGTDPANLAEALALHAATERIGADLVADTCGKSADCVGQLEALKAYIAKTCGGATANPDCPPTIVKFNDPLTSMQVNGQQPIPVVFPQAKDVAFVITMMEKDAAGGGSEGAAPDVIVVAVAQELGTSTATDVDWDAIKAKIVAADATTGAGIADKVQEALAAMPDNTTAASLVAGDAVPVAEAVAVLSAIAEELK